MIQFNLLPNVKIDYIKARRQKRLVISIAVIAGAVALAVFFILILVVDVAQKKSLSDLNGDIASSSNQLKNTPDLSKILTVQNQLGELTNLHNDKPVASRLFGYLTQITPTTATIGKLDTDFSQNSMTISGTASTLTVVNQFTDTLKFTTYKDDSGSSKKAFSSVVLSTFTRDNTTATYTIKLNFDPIIFSESSNVTLTVPNIISTRSAVEQPTALFQKDATSTTGSNQ